MEAGSKLGPYEIREQLGAGGMGEVWLAHDARLGRDVAVKILPTEFAADPERLARFEQEARAAAALNHPHIAAVFDVGAETVAGERATEDDTDGSDATGAPATVHYFVQERLDGQSLRELIAGGPLPLERARKLATEIAEALVAAHAAGIVHRDLKPENVFVTEAGHAKVLDFGLAKLTEQGGTSAAQTMSPTVIGTMTGVVMGTAGYMAPEQIEGRDIDHRADLFAFGCVLYEMLTGRGPFAGESVYDTLHRIGHSDPQPVHERRDEVPVPMRWIVRKCLAKDPAQRYQGAADLVVDLGAVDAAIEVLPALRAPTEATVVLDDAPIWTRPAMLRTLAPGAAMVLLAGALAGWLARAPEPTVEPPLRAFDLAFPDDYHQVVPCCGFNLALAPGGRFLVLAGTDPAQRSRFAQLFVRRLDGVETTSIGIPGAYMPSISPDGEWIAYLRSSRQESGIYKLALAGGEPFHLADAIGQPWWADDGYLYVAGTGRNTANRLLRVPENGGEPEPVQVTGLDEGTQIERIAALPGGRLALLDLADAGIALLDLESSVAAPLVSEGTSPRWVASGHVMWARGSVVYAAPFDPDRRTLTGRAVPVLQGVASGFTRDSQYAVADDGTLAWVPGGAQGPVLREFRLTSVDGDGTARAVSPRTATYSALRLSPDGRRIAVQVFEDDSGADDEPSDVWVLDIAQDTLARLTTDGDAGNPVWSPDGAWIYYRGGDVDIWRRRADFSAPPEAVLERAGAQWPEDITPDGAALLFSEVATPEDGEASDDIWILPLDGGDPEPLIASPADESQARVSPDGRLVAFRSDETGTNQIYVRELQGQRRWPISPGRGSSPVWARQGLSLHYVAFPAMAVVDMAFDADLELRPPRPAGPTPRLFRFFDVGADGSLLGYAPATGDAAEADDAAPRHDRVRVILNWFQELRRLAPPDR